MTKFNGSTKRSPLTLSGVEGAKTHNKPKTQNPKFKTIGMFLFLVLCFGICHYSFAQDGDRLVDLSKQIMEAKSIDEQCASFEALTDLYFAEHKYNEYADFLNSLIRQKKELEPAASYYLALDRYYQMKYLEEAQAWDEYFERGNSYRDQITQSAQRAIEALGQSEPLSVYARLVLWKFHRGQNDAFAAAALVDLLNSVQAYAKEANNPAPLKDVADELMAEDEKIKASDLYKMYVDKIITQGPKDEELEAGALNFYQEGNIELAKGLYKAYIQRIAQAAAPKEKLVPVLSKIARMFAYRDEGLSDPFYAEEVFQKIEERAGKDAFDEGLMYLRAWNLEKVKEYAQAKDIYAELARRFPEGDYTDRANYKIGLIYVYILRDTVSGRSYFEKLIQKEAPNSYAISSLYQLGLLAQWGQDNEQAKGYYDGLLQKAQESFPEAASRAKVRLAEIEENRPIEYNLKTFLDLSLSEEGAGFNMSKLHLISHPYQAKPGQPVSVNSTTYVGETGCFNVELQYIWSGDLGGSTPASGDSGFATSFNESGTKIINLVVTSSGGIVDRSLDLLDITP
jgi:TolA-binding protein